MQGWSFAELAAPALRPVEVPRQQWPLEALDCLRALRRLALVGCHLRPTALPLIASHAPRLQVRLHPPPPPPPPLGRPSLIDRAG